MQYRTAWGVGDPAGRAVSQGRVKGSQLGRGRNGAIQLSDLQKGAEVQGKVVTITSRGFFLDIGAACDAFVSWSKSTLREEEVRLGLYVEHVVIVDVNKEHGRITLRGPCPQFGTDGNIWGDWRQGVWEEWQGSTNQQFGYAKCGSGDTWDELSGGGDGSWEGDSWWQQQQKLKRQQQQQQQETWDDNSNQWCQHGAWWQHGEQLHNLEEDPHVAIEGNAESWTGAAAYEGKGKSYYGQKAPPQEATAGAFVTDPSSPKASKSSSTTNRPSESKAALAKSSKSGDQSVTRQDTDNDTWQFVEMANKMDTAHSQTASVSHDVRALAGEAAAATAAAEVGVAAAAATTATAETAAAPQSRSELKSFVFQALDVDANGRLDCHELRTFADATGFDGHDDEWQEEYGVLCEEVGANSAVGLDFEAFCSLIDDAGDQGCYTTDAELASILESTSRPQNQQQQEEQQHQEEQQQQQESALIVPPPGLVQAKLPQSRSELTHAVFERLDVGGSGWLTPHALKPFVLKTGFEGTDEDWNEEYVLLCKDLGCDPRRGLCKQDFVGMVDDQSDQGCYCTDDELRDMLLASEAAKNAGAASETSAEFSLPNGGKEIATGKDSYNNRKSQGKGLPAQKDVGEAEDPWESHIDPWSTNTAKKVKVRQQDWDAKAEAKAKEGWNEWREAGKPTAEDLHKPAMDAQKLLEASRAMIAARKAKEAEEAQARAIQEAQERTLREAQERAAAERTIAFETSGTNRGSSSRAPPPRGPKSTSMPATLAQIAAALAQVALGERKSIRSLVDAVLCAPNIPHALAVSSSALRLLLQRRTEEARVLLAVDVLHISPVDGDAALLGAVGDLTNSAGELAAPFLVKLVSAALNKLDDRQGATRSAAAAATEAIASCIDPFAFEALLPTLLAVLDSKKSPTMKLHTIRLLNHCKRNQHGKLAVAEQLPRLLPAIAGLMVDTAAEVRAAANDAVRGLLELCGNSDLEPYLGQIRACYDGSKDVTTFICELAEVVFVQQVEARALAAVVPVLVKGLRSRIMKTQRQTCVIAANMCRLVSSVADVHAVAPQLLPLLRRVSEDAADPDVRAVAGRAYASLENVAEVDLAGKIREELRAFLMDAVSAECDAERRHVFTPCPAHVRDVAVEYIVILSMGLARICKNQQEEWHERLVPLLEPLLGSGDVAKLVNCMYGIAGDLTLPDDHEQEAELPLGDGDDDGVGNGESLGMLCDCSLTLACGAATLLAGARLRLARGHVYGLIGANDSGKSTLLRALHDRRVVGFPDASQLVTALVEHGVGEHPPACDQLPLDYLLADPALQACKLSREEALTGLRSLGFDGGGRLKRPLRTLSGGWRMKLGLVRAMLQQADVLLLDEPTGHLDVAHISWLVDYICALRTDRLRLVTTLVVSHDVAFLDRVCTHTIHVQGQKLRTYPGNCSRFRELVPASEPLPAPGEEERPLTAFVLPNPGAIEGVRSKDKRFLYLQDVSYAYPSSNTLAVRRASVECSQRSRVAIVGPNGAGKSTVAALVVGELTPDMGSAWRHPSLRVAFVAQHAFHHLERHMDLTATQYILKRFEGHDDNEAADFKASELECEDPKTYCLQNGRLVRCDADDERKLHVETIVDRRQRGRLGYEYQVRWRGVNDVMWLSQFQLVEMGCWGMVKRENERQAAQRSLSARPLTTPAVEAHLAGFGLIAEEVSHRRLGSLSNGQRARVVLGAATWLAPHLLVLDEPTNYLDRFGLVALAAGLQGFGGGVLVISHTMTFVDEVCKERWIMEEGLLRQEGVPPPSPAMEHDADSGAGQASRITVASSISAKDAAKDKKRQKRLKELRKKNGEDIESDDDEWWGDLLKKANRPK